MQADFTVLDRNLLEVLQQGGGELPAVMATYVGGRCGFGCDQQAGEGGEKWSIP